MKRLIISKIPPDFNPANDILVGPSCLVGQEPLFHKWNSFNIVPSPFQTIDELRNTNEHSVRCANSLLKILADTLNKKNNITRSIKYWRILIYPWILQYVHVFSERYLRVEYLINNYSNINLNLKLVSNKHKLSFRNTFDFFFNGALNTDYNEYIISRLIEEKCPPNWKIKYFDKEPLKQQLPQQSWKMKLYQKHFTFLRCRNIAHMNFFPSVLFSILLSMKKTNEKVNFLYPQNDLIDDNFFSTLRNYIINEIPECYSELNQLENNNFKYKKGKIRIVDTASLYNNEEYKKFLANCFEGGEEIITSQHGGSFPKMFDTWSSELEFRHNRFLTWGWKQHGDYQCNFIDLPTPYLSKIANKHSRKNNKLIFVGTIINILSYELSNLLHTSHLIKYIDEKISFIKRLDKEIFPNLLYRPYVRSHGTINEVGLIKNEFPNIQLCENKLHDQLLNCKLLVLDHPGTTLSVAMSANIPTICYWGDSDHVPLSKSTDHSTSALKKVGILFDSAHDAATKVNEIWDDVDGWWAQKDIQEARQKFCWNYARTSKFWFFEWIKMIVSL